MNQPELEEHIFSKLENRRTETVIGPGVGKDCAVLDLSADLVVLSTDPITGTEKEIGTLCVNICCNDVAAAGGEPIALLLTMLIPESASMEQIDQIVADTVAACQSNGVDLIGGHTEINSAVNRFVLSGVCVGKKSKTPLRSVQGGDTLVMSKTAGYEGTGILAQEKSGELLRVLSGKELKDAQGYLDCTSVVTEGKIGVENHVLLMHDATEGGVFGAAWEMADSAGLGLTLQYSSIPVSEVTRKICGYFQIDPYRLISSGVMLFATDKPTELIRALKDNGIIAEAIGVLYG